MIPAQRRQEKEEAAYERKRLLLFPMVGAVRFELTAPAEQKDGTQQQTKVSSCSVYKNVHIRARFEATASTI
jgi:hypothetical protein